MRARLRRLAAVGLAAGCVEFAVRASPSLGLSLLEQLTFLTLACVAGALVALPGALSSRRSLGVGVGVVCAVHVCVAWRLGPAVNLPLSSLRVLSTLIVLSLGSLVACAALDSVFRRVERWLLPIGATAAALGLLLGRPFPVLPAQGPNLLLVTLDTVRADRLQPYGGALETPALQRLADEGVLFEQAIATAPLTEPSHLSILTGLRTRTTGVMANGTPLGEQPGLVSLRLQ